MISLPPKGDTAKKLGANFTPLKVEAQSIPTMTVKVTEGAFWNADNEFMEYIGGTSPTIAPPGTDAKWVLITVKSTGILNVVNGTPGTNPDLPAASSYQDELPLAAIFVGDTTTAITNEMIYDLRPLWSIPPDSVSQAQIDLLAPISYVDAGLLTKAGVGGTNNSDFTLNIGAGAINDSGFYIDRFAGDDVGIRFNELAMSPSGSPTGSPVVLVSSPQWEFTNDGTTWNPIGVAEGNYYLKTDLTGGALNFLYYTQSLLNGDFAGSPLLPVAGTGSLDIRYYTEAESDTLFAGAVHTHLVGDITNFTAQVQTINNIAPTGGDVVIGTSELNDMTTAGEADTHVLMYRTAWGEYRNGYFSADDIFNVDAAAPAVGDALLYSGSEYVSRAIIKSDISDFNDTDHVIAIATIGSPTTGTDQDVYGIKTFKSGIVVETSLTVTGDDTSIQTNELYVTDSFIDLNFGQPTPGVDGGTAGIRVDRGPATQGSPLDAGSPVNTALINPPAIIQWDESAKQWEIGVEGNAKPVLTGAHIHTSSQISDFAARTTTELAANSLIALGDVDYLSGPIDNDHLRYDTGEWKNYSFSTDVTTELAINNLDSLADVEYHGSPALAEGQILIYEVVDGWSNHNFSKDLIADFVESDYIHITGDETKTGNFALVGDLAVSGSTTTINSTTMNIADPFVTLNFGEAGPGVGGGTGNSGIEVDRGPTAGSPESRPPARLYWNEIALSWEASFGANAASQAELSLEGHSHLVSDISDLFASTTELNFLVGVTSLVQGQFDDKISRTGDTMDNSANLTFATGGEVLGLPATPSATAASSKEYVDTLDTATNLTLSTHMADATVHITATQNTFLDGLSINGSPVLLLASEVNQLIGVTANVQTQFDDKISRSGETGSPLATSVMDSGISLQFSGGGEVLGLPATPSATAAASREYVDAEAATVAAALAAHASNGGSPQGWHLTPNQNTFLDALDINGSPISLQASEVNFLVGVTSGVQAQLDLKANFVAGSPSVDGNLLKIAATGDMEDAGVAINDGGTGLTDLWTANRIDTIKANKVLGSPAAVAGNFAGLDAAGDLTDSGSAAVDFAIAAHTHTSGDVTDWASALNTYLGTTAVLADISDVIAVGAVTGDFLQRTGSGWDNVAPASITDFVHATDSVVESITGAKTFTADAAFQANVTVTGNFIVNGTTTTVNSANMEVADRDIVVNSGYTGATSGSTGSGIRVERNAGSGSPLTSSPNGVLLWDDALSQFTAGIDGSESEIATVAILDANYLRIDGVGIGSPLPATNDALVFDGANWSNAPVVNSFEGRVGAVVATAGDYTASEITYVPSGSPISIAATDVQAAIEELDAEKSATGHTHVLDDSTDVIVTTLAAGEVLVSSGSPLGWINNTLAEAGISATGHVHDAADVTFTAGSPQDIASGNVQDAIIELDTEKAPKASPVFTGVPVLPTYTVGTLPAVVDGGMIYVSDATSGPGSPLTITGVMCYGNTQGSPITWIDVITGLPVA